MPVIEEVVPFSFSSFGIEDIPEVDPYEIRSLEDRLNAIVETDYDDEGIEEWMPTLPSRKLVIHKPETVKRNTLKVSRPAKNPTGSNNAPVTNTEDVQEAIEEPIQSLTLEENVAPTSNAEPSAARLEATTAEEPKKPSELEELDLEIQKMRLLGEKEALSLKNLEVEKERVIAQQLLDDERSKLATIQKEAAHNKTLSTVKAFRNKPVEEVVEEEVEVRQNLPLGSNLSFIGTEVVEEVEVEEVEVSEGIEEIEEISEQPEQESREPNYLPLFNYKASMSELFKEPESEVEEVEVKEHKTLVAKKPDTFMRVDKFKGKINSRDFMNKLGTVKEHKSISVSNKDIEDFMARIEAAKK